MLPEGWTHRPLGELIGAIHAGVSVNGEDRPAREDEPAVLKVSAVTYGRFDRSENKAIKLDERERAQVNPKAGHILISRSNTAALVGASVYVPRDEPVLFLPDTVWQLEPAHDGSTNMQWLCHWLGSAQGRERLTSLANGTSGSMKKLSMASLRSLALPVPPRAQQAQIAAALNTWDDAIAATERLLANSRRQREVLASALLFGRIRRDARHLTAGVVATRVGNLPADWERVRLGRMCEEYNMRNSHQAELPVLSCTKHQGLVDSLTYFSKRVFSEDTSAYKVVPRGAFAYATNHIEEGSIGYQNLHDAALISPMYTVFRARGEIDDAYLFRLLKTEEYRQVFAACTNASVDRRGSLRWKSFSEIEVPVPTLQEQAWISETLAAAEAERSALQRSVDALRAEKRALTADLLTGKRRVRLDASGAA